MEMQGIVQGGGGEDDKEICSKCLTRFCNQKINEDMMWIGCDGCGKWYHSYCMNISNSACKRMEENSEDWYCDDKCKLIDNRD
jgi:hypothetical protein